MAFPYWPNVLILLSPQDSVSFECPLRQYFFLLLVHFLPKVQVPRRSGGDKMNLHLLRGYETMIQAYMHNNAGRIGTQKVPCQ